MVARSRLTVAVAWALAAIAISAAPAGEALRAIAVTATRTGAASSLHGSHAIGGVIVPTARRVDAAPTHHHQAIGQAARQAEHGLETPQTEKNE